MSQLDLTTYISQLEDTVQSLHGRIKEMEIEMTQMENELDYKIQDAVRRAEEKVANMQIPSLNLNLNTSQLSDVKVESLDLWECLNDMYKI
jgi:predicted nuclease with TOPRIM domain